MILDGEETHCGLCSTEFDIEKYGRGVCPACGMVHEWDEGYGMVLTSEQLRVLKAHALRKKFNSLPEKTTS